MWPGFIQVEETQFEAAVSEYTMQKMGQAMNAIKESLNWQVTSYTSPGAFAFIVPDSVTALLVEGTGGGGAGGAYAMYVMTGLTPGSTINGSVGAGGTGGLSPTAGGDSTFGSFRWYGGYAGGGGVNARNISNPYVGFGGKSGSGFTTDQLFDVRGGGQNGWPGGNLDNVGASYFGGGGSGGFGRGGNASYSGAAENGPSYGAGGGGCSNFAISAGNGANGIVNIYYLST